MRTMQRTRLGTRLPLLILAGAALAVALWRVGFASDPFEGIRDPAVLPMLRNLPTVHGGGNVSARRGRQLYDLVTRKAFKRGLEVGTSNGYSTLWLGLAFRDNGGTVTTIEYDPARAEEARRNFRRAGLSGTIDSRANDAYREIPLLEGGFDFVFLDAGDNDGFRRLVWPRVRPGGAVAECGLFGIISVTYKK